MPTYQIKAPDGNLYKIDGPAGASQADIQAEVLRQHPNAARAVSAGPQANTTPFQAPADIISPSPTTFANQMVGSVIPGVSQLVQLAHTIATGKGTMAPVGGDHTPANLKAAAQSGVDTTTGAPSGNVSAGFAPDVKTQLAVYQKNNPGVQWRIGPVSGTPEYLNKQTNRWTVAQPNAAETAIPSVIQGAGQTGGSLAGFALGGAAGGPAGAVIGSVGGSGVGSGAGRIATNYIGKKLGALPSDMPVTQGATGDALTGAVMDLGGQAVLGLAKYLRYLTKGKRFFTDQDFQVLLNAQKRAQGLIQKIRQGSGMSFNPDAAQIAAAPGSPISATTAAAKAAAARTFASGNETSRLAVAQNQAQNEAALRGYFDNLLVDHQLQGLNPQQAANNVAEGLTNPFHVAQAAARDAIAKLPPDAQREQAAKITRAAVQAAHDNFEATIEKPAWKAYNDAIGFDPITHSSNIQVPWTQNVRDLMTGWSAEERKALVGLVGQDSGRLTVNFGEGTPDVFSQVLDKNGIPFLLKKGEPAQGADLADVDSAIKWLRQNARTGMSGKQGVVLPTAKLNQLAGAMTDMRNSFLEANHPNVKNLLDVAEGTSREKAGRFGTGLLDTILTNGSDGKPRLTDLEALDRLLGTPDQATIRPVTDILKGNPVAKDQLNQYILAKAREETVDPDTGIPSYSKYKMFMNKYRPFIQSMFAPSDYAGLEQVGGLSKKIIDETKILRTFLPKMYTDPTGAVSVLDPKKLVTGLLTSGSSLNKTNLMIRNMKKYPYADHTFEQWRAVLADHLHSMIFKNGEFQQGTLGNLLNGNLGENLAVIEKLFNTDGKLGGTKIVQGLKTLHEASQLAHNIQIGGAAPDQTTLLQRGLRTYFHPFSEEGRFMDFLKRERVRENPSVMYRYLTDPDAMQYAAGETKRTMKAIRNIGISAGVGNAVREYLATHGSSIPQNKQQGQGINTSAY